MKRIGTADWPGRLCRGTGGFKRHHCWRGFWPAAAELRRMVADMFDGFGSATELPVLRVYVNRGQRFDLAAKLAASPAHGRGTFERRLADVIGHQKFCVTLNGLTRWNESFHLLMQKHFVKPLFATSGFPSGGADFYAFIGNYGFTPFGIHDDEEHSLLLHLGAREKLVYLWPARVFPEASRGPMSNFDFRGMRRWACSYTLDPGDLLFIPKGDYHVLYSRGFSITLGFTIFPATPADNCVQAMRLLHDEPRPATVFTRETDWEAAAVQEGVALDSAEFSHHIWRHRMLLKSNGYITTTPLEAARAPGETELKRLRFQVPPQFKIYYGERDSRLEVFARGQSLRVRTSLCLKKLLEFLNRHQPFRYEQFVNFLAAEWPEIAIRRLFDTLYKIRAICRAQSLRK